MLLEQVIRDVRGRRRRILASAVGIAVSVILIQVVVGDGRAGNMLDAVVAIAAFLRLYRGDEDQGT